MIPELLNFYWFFLHSPYLKINYSSVNSSTLNHLLLIMQTQYVHTVYRTLQFIILFYRHSFLLLHFIYLNGLKQFISLCANTHINISPWKGLPAPWWYRQIFSPSFFYCDKSANPCGDVWDSWLRTHDPGSVYRQNRPQRNFTLPQSLMSGGRGPWGQTRGEKTKKANALFHPCTHRKLDLLLI